MIAKCEHIMEREVIHSSKLKDVILIRHVCMICSYVTKFRSKDLSQKNLVRQNGRKPSYIYPAYRACCIYCGQNIKTFAIIKRHECKKLKIIRYNSYREIL